MFLKIDDAIKQIEQRRNRNHGLDPLRTFFNKIDNPHFKVPVIHVAGTNGKGSTVNYIRSILQAQGLKVGTFTSPYLICHQDRIRINDQNIDDVSFLKFTNEYFDSFLDYDLGMFEIDMVIGALYFQQEAVDIAIYEVGLGGRLDTTNLLMPICCAISNIGMDHMELLGDTFLKIASEKAGIIKCGIPIVTAEKKDECLTLFESVCMDKQAPFYKIKQPQSIEIVDNIHFDYGRLKNLILNTKAYYQIDNACLAIEVIEILRNACGYHIVDSSIRDGLEKAIWRGRFEVMGSDPTIIIDGAHNPQGVEALVESMKSYQDIHIIFSVMKDKSYDEMIDCLLTLSDDITVCDFQSDRCIDASLLASHRHLKLDHNYIHAIEEGKRKGGTLLITGSLLFISFVREYFMNI